MDPEGGWMVPSVAAVDVGPMLNFWWLLVCAKKEIGDDETKWIHRKVIGLAVVFELS